MIKCVLMDCWDTIIKYGVKESFYWVKNLYNNYVTSESKNDVTLDELLNFTKEFFAYHFKNNTIDFDIEKFFNLLLTTFGLDIKLIPNKTKSQTINQILIESFTPSKIDYVDELVEFLRINNIKVAILSNTIFTYDFTYEMIRSCYQGKFIFDYLLCSQDVICKKPDTRFFNCGLKLSDVKANETIYVGDSFYADCYGSNKANFLYSIHMNWKEIEVTQEDLEKLDDKNKYVEIKDYRQLIEFIKEKNKNA